MIIKGKVFNSFLKEYIGIFEICSFHLEFVEEDQDDCQITCTLNNGKEIYIPIELEDYNSLADELYKTKQLDLSQFDYSIYIQK